MLSSCVYINFWRQSNSQSYLGQTGNHLSDGFCRILIISYQKKASESFWTCTDCIVGMGWGMECSGLGMWNQQVTLSTLQLQVAWVHCAEPAAAWITWKKMHLDVTKAAGSSPAWGTNFFFFNLASVSASDINCQCSCGQIISCFPLPSSLPDLPRSHLYRAVCSDPTQAPYSPPAALHTAAWNAM